MKAYEEEIRHRAALGHGDFGWLKVVNFLLSVIDALRQQALTEGTGHDASGKRLIRVPASDWRVEVYELIPACERCGKTYGGLNEYEFVSFLSGDVDDPICDACIEKEGHA